jgi:hypothetical protein
MNRLPQTSLHGTLLAAYRERANNVGQNEATGGKIHLNSVDRRLPKEN